MIKKLLALAVTGIFIFSLTGMTYKQEALLALAKDTVTVSSGSKVLTTQSATTPNTKAKLNTEEATTIAKKYLKDYFGYELEEKLFQFNSQLNPSYGLKEGSTWNLSWFSYTGTNNTNINITIDGDSGKLLNVNLNDSQTTQLKIQVPKYTEEEGKKAAEAFLTKIDPTLLNNTILTKNPYYVYNSGYSNSYDYKFVRVVNGIEYADNFVEVWYDGVSGKIISYNNTWDDSLVFPGKDKVVDESKATESYKNSMKTMLKYITYSEGFDNNKQAQTVKLVYAPSLEDGAVIDANTGEMLKLYPYNGKIDKIDLSDNDKTEFLKSYKEMSGNKKEIDKDGAMEIAKKFLSEECTTESAVDYMSYQQNNFNGVNGDPSWTGQFKLSAEDMSNGNVSIDAVTGEITSLYAYNSGNIGQEKFTPKLSQEEAYKKAIDIIEKFYPSKIKDITTEQTILNTTSYVNGKEITNPNYYFVFYGKVNGIEFNQRFIQIAFDARTGKIANLYSNWDEKLKFPDNKNIVAPGDANKTYTDSSKMSLEYVTNQKYDDSGNMTQEIKLVYVPKINGYTTLSFPFYIDSITGKLVDYNGINVVDGANNSFEVSIKGNQYEKELLSMAALGGIDTGAFDSNKEVTRADLINVIVLIKGIRYNSAMKLPDLKFTDIKSDDGNYLNLQKAVSYGIIKNDATEVKLSQVLTREDIIKTIIELTPYSTLAEAKDIFMLNYTDTKDISSDKFGYIAVAKGLKILDGNIDKLSPKESVKLGELYHYIYNASQYITIN